MSSATPIDAARAAEQTYVASLLDLLGARDPLDVQRALLASLDAALSGLDDASVRRPEAIGKWSVIEVVQHLADTELVCGFRYRMMLAEDAPAIQGFDQDRWAAALGYGRGTLDVALAQLRALRGANLGMLAPLTGAQWARVGVHPVRGAESIRHLVTLTAGHDLLHLRQIARIRRAIGAA
jgi:hypothetical protein